MSPVGLICISLGVLFIYPLFWMVTSKPYRRSLWVFLILATALLCGFAGYLLLYGDLFNPWFSAFSYLKSILLKIVTLVVAGALVLVFEELISAEMTPSPGFGKYWALMAFVPVPGVGTGNFQEGHNLANYIDQQYLPLKKYDGDYDPEGLLSTIPAIGTTSWVSSLDFY